MSSHSKNNVKSREAQVLERQRDIAMIRAAAAAEASASSASHAAKPPSKGAAGNAGSGSQSLSSLAGRSATATSCGTTHNPICLDHTCDVKADAKPALKRARPRIKPETVLAEARQRVGSVTAEEEGIHQKGAGDAVEKKSTLPSLRSLPAASTTTATKSQRVPGSLTNLLLSNSDTAKYLQKDAPKLLKHYPKIEPNDYWKNLRQWDFLRELNERMMADSNKRQNGKRKRKKTDDSNKNDNDSTHDKQQQQQQPAQPLPDTFQSHREYCALWAPLLLHETRAQLLSDAISEIPSWKSKPDKSPVRVMLQPRKKDLESTSDGLGIVVKEVVGEYQDRMFMANDIVVLVTEESMLWGATKGKLNDTNNSATQQIQSSMTEASQACIVGHIEHTRRSIEGLVITLSRNLWSHIGSQEMSLLKIGSNVTSLREFTALCRMDRLPLAEYILCTKMNTADTNDTKDSGICTTTTDNENVDASFKEKQAKKQILERLGGASALGKGFADYASQKFNLSQLEAVSASAAEYGNGGFTLIKGPPGTGKTTTLCALLNALHIRQMNQYFGEVKVLAESYNAVVGKRATLSLSDAAKKRPRILVCAPSNAAVDNIILKIMEDGFIDGNGMRYNPSIVRVGSGQSASVKDVCLEDKVESYLSESMDVAKLENTIEGLKGECRRIHSDITKLRQRMNVMKNAAPYPLSKNWEIRIDEETVDSGPRVYFVNHKEKTTTYEVPPPPEPGEKHFPARAMPEYKAFVSRVVKMVERYNNISAKIEHYSLCRNAAAAAAASGGSSAAHSHAMSNVRTQLETYILDSVHIVMTTLGTAGNRALEGANKFEVVVIDEAAQSVEPSTLAGLQLGSSHAILVGDPQQLPATIFSISGRDTKYDRSLFARLEEAGHAVHMLDTQYRMHPAISDFPRRIFYDGKLADGPNVKHPEYGNPLKMTVFKKFPAFQPFTILDLESSEERGGTSLSNSAEAQLALHLFNTLKSGTNGLSTKSRVAVITPYAQQAALLRRTFSNSFGGDYERFVEVNTVDAFQGREANIGELVFEIFPLFVSLAETMFAKTYPIDPQRMAVIFSCVRAAGSKGIGFLSDVRRMNVALTRAKNFLFVIARCSSIVVNPYWKDLVEHARETDAVISVPFSGSRQSTFNFPDLSTLKAASARGKRLMNDKEILGDVEDDQRKRTVIELMGLKLEIPQTKRPNR